MIIFELTCLVICYTGAETIRPILNLKISNLVILVCMLSLFIVLYDTGLFCLYDMCELK